MKITIDKLDDELHMEAENQQGGRIRMNGTQRSDGLDGGMSPMQLLLAAAGGCSAIDVVGILEKKRQQIDDFQIEVSGERVKKETYKEFTTIHLHFRLTGELDPGKVEKAIELSVGKYCSVSKALEAKSEISYSFEIVQRNSKDT